MERDRLMDAVRRHHSLLSARAVQDLLGLRQAIDQPMVSIVQNEIVERKALKYPNPGLLPVVEQCFSENEGWWNTRKWIAFLPGGGSIDLRRVFYHGLFNYASAYEREDNGSIRLVLEAGAYKSSEKEGWYPVRARFGDQIPLEYIWAAKGRLNPGEEANHYAKMTIEKRTFRDYPLNRERITDNDLTVLGAKLCHALEHVERSLSRGRNLRLTKRPIAIPRIEEFTLGETSLQRGCNEYLALEYFFKRQELFAYHALAPIQRVATGRSLVLSCTSAVDQGKDVVLEGRLIYREMVFPNVQQIVNACRIKGSDGLSSGDWMLSTEVHWSENGQIEEVEERSPSRIELSSRAIVEDLDLANLTIRAKVLGYPREEG